MEARKNKWTEKEDQLLAKTVITNIKKGKTQLDAFKEVGEEINRTASACGFRWNSTLRKKYKEEIAKAKEQKKGKSSSTEEVKKEAEITLKDVIQYLQTLEEEWIKNIELKEQLTKLQEKYATLEKDYRSLQSIVDKVKETIKI